MNTMAEGLSTLRSLVSDMKSMPDADLPWLIELETQILSKEREPIDQLSAQGVAPNAVPGGLGPTPGGMGVVPGGAGAPGPDTVAPGGAPATGLPDEIRRLLKQ